MNKIVHSTTVYEPEQRCATCQEFINDIKWYHGRLLKKMKPKRDMNNLKSQKRSYDKIGRSFCLVFNRVTMYKMDHPYTVQAVTAFYNTVRQGLNISSEIVFIMKHGQFFIEEEPLDGWLKTSRMVGHFKKSAIESISFEKGIKEAEVENFFRVFCDRRQYPEADAMREKIAELGVTHVKINFVFYNKITSDERVILEDKLKRMLEKEKINPSKEVVKEILNRIAEGADLEEIARSISRKNLLEDTAKFSKQLIKSDLSAFSSAAGIADHMIKTGVSNSPGSIIENQVLSSEEGLHRSEPGQAEIDLAELANAVLDMKANQLAVIEEKKPLGIKFENESQILNEADDITDRVIVQLVKEEYKNGAISIQRLGPILRRIIPDSKGLLRLLHKLKEAMLEKGLSVAELVILVKKIGKDLQSDELSEALKKSAEKIGLDNDGLFRELKFEPDGAAELIYLASEIRNASGDEKVLAELLVDYT